MKTIIGTFLFVTSMACAIATESLSDSWSVEQDIAGNSSTMSIVLKQEGNLLKGTVKMPEKKELPITGKIENGSITWQYPTEWEGNELTMVYTGKLTAEGHLVGTVEVQPMGVEGEFKAKRAAKK